MECKCLLFYDVETADTHLHICIDIVVPSESRATAVNARSHNYRFSLVSKPSNTISNKMIDKIETPSILSKQINALAAVYNENTIRNCILCKIPLSLKTKC